MLTCRELTELCSRELDQEMTLGQKVSMHSHLLMCSGCSNYRRQLSMLHNAARRYAEGEAPSVPFDQDPSR